MAIPCAVLPSFSFLNALDYKISISPTVLDRHLPVSDFLAPADYLAEPVLVPHNFVGFRTVINTN